MYFTKGVEFQTWIRNYLYKGNPARFFMLFKFYRIAIFWNVQKHEKLHFGLSEMFRSVKNFILVFLKCSEAWKTSFLSFCSVQKHEKLLFGLSAMCRSMKNFILAFLKCSEAWKTSIWCFWNVQKHVFFLFSLFRAPLKHLKSLFRLSAPRLSTKNLFFAFPRRA